MSERVFPSGTWEADDDRATTLVCDLLAGLLDAVSRPVHDWPALRRQTDTLLEITAAMATAYPVRGGPKRDR